MKFRQLRQDIKVAAFLTWLAEKFSSQSWPILFTSNGATSFLEWICPKYSKSYKKSEKTRQPTKVLLFLSFSAERFDCSSSPTYKKYLPLPNQLQFWTEHIQRIVKVKNEV